MRLYELHKSIKRELRELRKTFNSSSKNIYCSHPIKKIWVEKEKPVSMSSGDFFYLKTQMIQHPGGMQCDLDIAGLAFGGIGDEFLGQFDDVVFHCRSGFERGVLGKISR